MLVGCFEPIFSRADIVLGVIVAVMILHEAVHGLVFLIVGAKPRFRVKLMGSFFPVASI